MAKINFITHTAPLGESITYQIRHLMGMRFLNMAINFDPVDHIAFANNRIPSVPGVASFASMQVTGTPSYFFTLKKDYNPDVVMAGIKDEFENYFLTLEKYPLK